MNLNNIIGLILLVSSPSISSQESFMSPKLEKIWETPKELCVCESSHYNPKDNTIYVSNIVGKPNEKDGIGFISKIDVDGHIIQLGWFSGLNAPKGIGCSSKSLFVTDIDRVVEIDLKSGKFVKEYRNAITKSLNDIAVSSNNQVFATETDGKHIFVVGRDSLEIFIESDQLGNMNGIYVKDKELFLGSKGNFISIDRKTKVIKELVEKVGYLDGIEQIAEAKFITSNWAGKVQLIEIGKGCETLINTSALKINAADLGYIASKKILLVPTFKTNSVVAYKLKF